MLSMPPEKINLWDLLSVLEPKLTIVDCMNGENICTSSNDCLIRPVWEKAYQAMVKLFKETTLFDIINPHDEKKQITIS